MRLRNRCVMAVTLPGLLRKPKYGSRRDMIPSPYKYERLIYLYDLSDSFGGSASPRRRCFSASYIWEYSRNLASAPGAWRSRRKASLRAWYTKIESWALGIGGFGLTEEQVRSAGWYEWYTQYPEIASEPGIGHTYIVLF